MSSEAASRAPAPWTEPGAVLLVSCYELGRQPFNIASPWAQLEAAGFGVQGLDVAVEPIGEDVGRGARLVAVSVPMHTALRLGIELCKKLRERAPEAHVCFFGLYAGLNAPLLLSSVADSVIGGEFEVALVELCLALAHGCAGEAPVDGVVLATDPRAAGAAPPILRKLPFVVPARDRLPPLRDYAKLLGPRPGETRIVGYVEASRGCRHACRHCPVTPVYQRRFFVIPQEVVLADAAQQIAAGARHITFGDPDFLNGPKHALQVARALHRAHPDVTFDVTIKIEHILRHRQAVAELRGLGCAFVISAVESLSDEVLCRLDKGHTRAGVLEALSICRAAGLPLRPSLVAFTPWTTLDDYLDLVEWIVAESLIDHLDPIHLAIRLLVPPGSALLWGDEPRPWLGELVPEELGHRWRHPDERMDRLFAEVSDIVEQGVDDDPADVVLRVRERAYHAAGRTPPPTPTLVRRFVPRLAESWFCCAEPTEKQLAALHHAKPCCEN